MKYTVVWVGTAEQALTEIWLAAKDRNAVSAAAQSIDHALETNPLGVGESRDFGQRIVFVAPLAVIYSVRSQENLVRVRRVWTIRPWQR